LYSFEKNVSRGGEGEGYEKSENVHYLGIFLTSCGKIFSVGGLFCFLCATYFLFHHKKDCGEKQLEKMTGKEFFQRI
jgi:hypothetical protein